MENVIDLKLKELLEGKGWSIYKLAQQSGISYNNCHRIATGRAKVMSLEVLDTLCSTLDCTPNDIFAFTKPLSED